MADHEIKPYDTSWTGKKDVNLRNYTNLYVDSKMEDPIGDSIKLGFISDIEDIVFRKDSFTYFHFPMKDIGENLTSIEINGFEGNKIVRTPSGDAPGYTYPYYWTGIGCHFYTDSEVPEVSSYAHGTKSGGFSYVILKTNTEKQNNYVVDISATSIINDGATYGSCPYKSDRIYKLRYNYEDSSPYGRAQPEEISNGTWLCSWLSGDVLDPDKTPVWYDRWFDPTKVTEEEALAATATNIEGGVYDAPSIMSFDHGAYYKYWRVGEKTIRSIADLPNMGGSLIIRLNDWADDYANKRITYLNPTESSFDNYRVSHDFDDDDYAVTFNGKNQLAIVPYSDETKFATQDEYSVIFWVKCDDWKNCMSYSIVDNMFMGGWKFGITNTSKNSFIFLYGNDKKNPLQDGTTCLFNNKGELVSTKSYWKSDDNPNLVDMVVDTDLFSYVLDVDTENRVSRIHKVDFNGNRLCTLQIEAVLKFLDISSYENGYMLYAYTNDSSPKLYVIDRYEMTVKSSGTNGISLVPYTNGAIVKINRNPNYVEYFVCDRTSYWLTEGLEDTNDGYPLEVSNGDSRKISYYKYTDMVDSICVTVDYNGTAYILKEDKIEKWDIVFHRYQKTAEFKLKAGIKPTLVDIVNRNVLGKNVDRVLVLSEEKQCIYVYSTDGEYIEEYDTSKFYVKPKNQRHVTMYDYYRMNRVQTNNVYFDLFGFSGHNIISKDLSMVSDLEWHQMAAVVKRTSTAGDKPTYNVSFYFDCIKVGEIAALEGEYSQNADGSGRYPKSTKYYYDSPIVIGGRCGKIFPLLEEINVCNSSFNGSIDDFRIYDFPVTQEDLYYIYMSKFACDDLIWHFTTDRRNMVENIERFYKLKMPGSKSAHYVLHICGYRDSRGKIDEKLKSILEAMIRRSLKRLTPAYSSLIKIEWD